MRTQRSRSSESGPTVNWRPFLGARKVINSRKRQSGCKGGRLEGKRTLITGASSGIGRATAVRFAQEGALVGLVARRQSLLEEVAEIIRAHGGQALALPTDVSKEHEVEQAVSRVVDEWGRLD